MSSARVSLAAPLGLAQILLAACGNVEAIPADGGMDGESGDAAPPDAFVEPNVVFVTTTRHTGALGGLGGADAICNQRASEAGLGGNYVAWLSTVNTDAKDRLAGARGWVRTDGLPFADTVDDILAGRIFYPADRDENGNAEIAGNVWTGTGPDGTFDSANGDCGDWMFGSDSMEAMRGVASGGFEMFTAQRSAGCNLTNSLLCFGVDRSARVEGPSESGRLAFVTRDSADGATGVSGFDSMCADEAAEAGLSGTFLAAVSDGDTAPSGRMDLDGQPWVRADGVKLFDSAGDIDESGGLLAPIQYTADGEEVVNRSVWTGAADFSGVNPNCADWEDPELSGIIGKSAIGGVSGASFNGADCVSLLPVYCFEQ